MAYLGIQGPAWDEIDCHRPVLYRSLMKSLVQALTRRGAAAVAHQLTLQPAWENLLLLQGAQAALQLRGLDRLSSLQDAEFKVFSQWGEDGIIEWLISHLHGIPQSFIEFGVENYTEANTRFLLMNRHWRGLIMDGSKRNMEAVRARNDFWKYDLTALDAFVTRDNINSLIADAGFGGEVGLLSVDIDGNDYWVWEAISAANPWIVIVEYNAVLGDLKPLTISYEAGFSRMAAHHSGLYWGASAAAFDFLAARKGYVRAGGNRAGNNLFYLRKDLMAGIEPLIVDRSVRPSLYAEARDRQGALTLTRGAARRDLINDMPVTDVASGSAGPLSGMGELYSPQWAAMLGKATQAEHRLHR
jgi:hypothetical protein